MAARFAGDYFGIALTGPQEGSSTLLEYFPDLRSAPVARNAQAKQESDKESDIYRSVKATPVFGGFKAFEKSKTQKQAAPVFGGFKTFEQPK